MDHWREAPHQARSASKPDWPPRVERHRTNNGNILLGEHPRSPRTLCRKDSRWRPPASKFSAQDGRDGVTTEPPSPTRRPRYEGDVAGRLVKTAKRYRSSLNRRNIGADMRMGGAETFKALGSTIGPLYTAGRYRQLPPRHGHRPMESSHVGRPGRTIAAAKRVPHLRQKIGSRFQ
jgi:hypothetical protein